MTAVTAPDLQQGVLGIAVLAGVFANQGGYETPTAFVDGYVPALLLGAATVAPGAAAALLTPRRRAERGCARAGRSSRIGEA